MNSDFRVVTKPSGSPAAAGRKGPDRTVGGLFWLFLLIEPVYFSFVALVPSLDGNILVIVVARCAIALVALLRASRSRRSSPSSRIMRSRHLPLLLYAVLFASLLATSVEFPGAPGVETYIRYSLAYAPTALIMGLAVSGRDLVNSLTPALRLAAATTILMIVSHRRTNIDATGYFNDLGGASHLLIGQSAVICIIVACASLLLRGFAQVIAPATIVCAVYLILISGSRGALLSAGAALAFMFLSTVLRASEQRRFTGIWRSVVALALVATFGAQVFTRIDQGSLARQKFESIFTGGDAGILVRQQLYAKAWELFSANPAFGGGAGSFPAHMGYYIYPHNMFLEIGVDFGAVGLAIFAILIFRRLRFCLRRADWVLAGALLTGTVTILQFSGSYAINSLLWLSLVVSSPEPEIPTDEGAAHHASGSHG